MNYNIKEKSKIYPNNIDKTAVWLSHMIRWRRKELALTQSSIANSLGMGMTSISSIESGKSFANIKRTIQVMNVLGLPLAALLSAIEKLNVIHNTDVPNNLITENAEFFAWQDLDKY